MPDIKYKKGFATKREAEKYDEKLKLGLCGKHGGGRRCEVAGCGRMARGKSGVCSRHKSEAKAKHRTSDEASEPQVTDEVKQAAQVVDGAI